MAFESVGLATFAPQGSGKTYLRAARFVFDEWLPENDGVHWSNFPFRLDPWEDDQGQAGRGLIAEASERYQLPEHEIRRRVRTFPPEEIASWSLGDRGPWDYFEELYREECRERGVDPDDPENGVEHPLQNAHVALDEAYHFYPNKARGKHKAAIQRCQKWLAEIRHVGATVEFICQFEYQIAPEVRHLCATHIQITNLENEAEPITGATLGDWFQVRAKLTGKYSSFVRQDYYVQDGKGRKRARSLTSSFDPFYFALYDSFSKPQSGGKAGKARKRQWERLSWPIFLIDMYLRNFFAWTLRLGGLGLAVWLLFFGGARVVAGYMMQSIGSAAESQFDVGEDAPSPAADVPHVREFWPESARQDVAELESALALQEQEIVRLREHRNELAARLGDAESIVMVTSNGITFRNGDQYEVGQRIMYGTYEGRVLAEVDWIHRAALLDDGTRLRLGVHEYAVSGLQFDGVGYGEATAGVSGPLPRASEVGGGAPTPASRGEAADDVSFRNALVPVRPLHLERDGGVDRGGVTIRPSPGYDRGGQSADFGSAGSRQPSVGNGVGSQEESVLRRFPPARR